MGSIAEVAALTMLFEACEDEQVKRNVIMLCPELRLFVGKVYMPETVSTQGSSKEPKVYWLVANTKEGAYLNRREIVCPPAEVQSYADRFQGQMQSQTINSEVVVTIEEQKSE